MANFRVFWRGVFVFLFVFSFWRVEFALCAAKEPRVETVAVTVVAARNLPPLVAKRMAGSIKSVAEQLTEGATVENALFKKAQNEQIIREVFDKILVGYTVRSVSINPAQNLTVTVAIEPWSDTINAVTVEKTIEGAPTQYVADMITADLAGVDDVFVETLQGLPILATDWTQGILKRRLNEFMAEKLPEFRADFDVLPVKDDIKVHLTVYPKLPVVRTTELYMRSETVPNFVLLGYRKLMQDKINDLIGLPADFVARHEKNFTDNFAAFIDSQKDFRNLGLKTTLQFENGENLKVTSHSDTEKYILRLEGWLDISRKNKDDAVKFRLHAGKKLSKADEIFLLTDFVPAKLRAYVDVGYARTLSSKTRAEVRWDFDDNGFVIGGRQNAAA